MTFRPVSGVLRSKGLAEISEMQIDEIVKHILVMNDN
jgi:hypothetical protein